MKDEWFFGVRAITPVEMCGNADGSKDHMVTNISVSPYRAKLNDRFNMPGLRNEELHTASCQRFRA